MAFDITSVLKGAAAKTVQEQIVYIQLADLDPDPNNFYTLEDIEDLAANIALIGLQQPIRVRPGKDGHYIVVSGHRRRAACLLIQDGEDDSCHMFDGGVPCIIDDDSCSDAMRQLRLIYANSATRVMTPAEISKQAEQVEALLYKLKEEEGIKFPGRMREHVAQACAVSKSKLARLHAIRKNLAPDLVSVYFDKGTMAESVAYELSKHDQSTQRWTVDTYKTTHPKSGVEDMQEWWVKNFASCASKMTEMHCREIAGGGECIHQREHVEFVWRKGYEGFEGCVRSGSGSKPKCCIDCDSLASCSVSCPRCDRKKAKLKADLKAKRQSERETKKADEENRKLQKELDKSQAALYWARLGGALKDAGTDFWTLQDSIDEDHYRTGKDNRVLCSWLLEPADIEALLDGKPAKNDGREIPIPVWEYMDSDGPAFARILCKMADLLGVSLDYLFLRTDNPAGMAVSESDTEPQWKKGRPPVSGLYAVKSGVPKEEGPQWTARRVIVWTGDAWVTNGPGVPVNDNIYGWMKLPED